MREPHKGFRPDLIHTRVLEGPVLKNRIDKPTATLLAAATLVGGLGLATPAMAAPATPKPEPTITLPADLATGKDEPQPAPVTWPLLGTTLEMGEDGTLTATQSDTHPAVSIPATWNAGEEIKLSDGTPFTLYAQGVWHATYGHELTLRDDNGVPVKNLGLSDGSKTPSTGPNRRSRTARPSARAPQAAPSKARSGRPRSLQAATPTTPSSPSSLPKPTTS